MENYLVVLLLSGLVLLSEFYGYNVEQRIFQIKDDVVNAKIQHANEIKKVKVELESTREQISAHRKEMIEKDNAYRKEIAQIKENAMKFKDEFVNTEMLHKNETKKVKEDLKSMSEQINVYSKEMTEKDDACKKEKDQIKETIKLLKETDIRYENTLRDIRKEKEEHDIAFSARLETSIADINPWDTVVFDQVASNNGNSYNAATGIFTAPLAGTYFFSSTIFTKMGSIVEMSLKVNEQTEMWMYACSTTLPGNTATNSVIVKLNKNDTVRITKLASYGSRPFYIHHVWSTFTGFLF